LKYKDNADGSLFNNVSNSYDVKCDKCIGGFYGDNCENEAVCWGNDNEVDQAQRCAQSAKCVNWSNWPNVNFSANKFDCETCAEGKNSDPKALTERIYLFKIKCF
jgi:hypothetical protein